MLERVKKIIKYIPAILIGLCLPFFLSIAVREIGDVFAIQEHLANTEDLNAGSTIYLAVSALDSFIVFFTVLIVLLVYRSLKGVLPYNYVMVLLMQLPLLLVTVRRESYHFDVSTIYGVGSAISAVILCTSVFVSYLVIQKCSKYYGQKQQSL